MSEYLLASGFSHRTILILFIAMILGNSQLLMAQESTTLRVRVLSKDAKFIGSGMGGARIEIKDLSTGEILSSGLTEGETGNTEVLVEDARERYPQLSFEGDAYFEAKLMLKAPTKVQVTASAPMNTPDNLITISDELWLIPGKNISGDGFIMEMPGFSVRIQEPIQFLAETEKLEIKAKVIMLCGCPTEPGGLWDSSEMQIEAAVYRDGRLITKEKMEFTGKTSVYRGEIGLQEAGEYDLYVTVFDPRNANTGVDRVRITY